MPSPSHPVERFSFSTALFGMLVLTLGMGLGRFLYTPMLPVMMAEGSFSFSQLSWIASGNYAGYLAGSLLFSFDAFHQPSRLRPFLLASALASGLLILAMAWLLPFILVLLIRVLAGVASAGMLIFGSTLIMQHTRHPFVLAALFSGVGIGIALGNEYVLAGLHFDLSSQTLWQGAGALSGMMLIALTLLMPSKKHAITPMPLAKTEQQIMSWWLLAILYGLAGFGYIIVATYLPLMAKDAGSPLLTAHLWTLVGLSIVPGCFGWLWAAKRWGGFALPDGEFAGAGYLCAAYSRQRLASLAYHQQSWFWRYLYGYDISGDDYRPPTERTGKSQSFRLCDAHLRHWTNPRPGADQYARQWNIGACRRHSLRRGGVVYCCAYQHSTII